MIADISLRRGLPSDADSIIRLNAESVAATSPMDGQRLRELTDLSHSLTVATGGDGDVVGFLLGFADGSAYDSVNYRWFAQRLKRFFYIDRIVVAARCRGAGLGQQFYSHAAAAALSDDFVWLAAEMNLEPPNPASLRFHARQGFVEIGQQQLADDKRVSLQVCGLAPRINVTGR